MILDIVSDEPVPEALRQDAHLWSGCISGALSQTEFLEGFREAGFHGMTLLKRDDQPWQTVEGTEFRSVTVEAFKSGQGPRLERHQAVIYKGPFASVTDDVGHTYLRGQPMAVCHQTFERMGLKPYRNLFERIEPSDPRSCGEGLCLSWLSHADQGTQGTQANDVRQLLGQLLRFLLLLGLGSRVPWGR